MNPGQFNKRVQFFQNNSVQNEYGGTTTDSVEILTTWGSLEPYRQYKQITETADITQLDSAIVLKIRYRDSFQPDKSMMFRDVSDPNEVNPPVYAIQSILPYYPGAKQSFQNAQETVYQNKLFVWIVGIKTDDSYINIVS